ncbi:hypothetical protein KRX19_01480 [Cardiobacteriaceae bacterium TAE3-ERU3]|nr:hypothetical protein [Cardiobacteriaceae bacterium TAE3-ERU3]
MNTSIGKTLLNATQIAQGVACVAEQLNTAFSGKSTVVMTVVPGGIFFSADLLRQLTFPVKMDYISCPHRPGDRHNTSAITYPHNIAIDGQHVIVVDDAVESGGTMQRIIQYLHDQHRPASLSVATLFVKPGRRTLSAPLYYGHEMDNDDLLVGYGLPWQDRYRNLPFIAQLMP